MSGGEREWSGGGREWSGMMEGVVWCDGGLLLVDGEWSSMVGVAGWALLSVGVIREWGVVIHRWALSSVGRWWSFVMGLLLFMGGGLSFVVSTLQCPSHSCRNPPESTGFHRNGTGICRNPQESSGICRNGTGIHRNPQEWDSNRTGIE